MNPTPDTDSHVSKNSQSVILSMIHVILFFLFILFQIFFGNQWIHSTYFIGGVLFLYACISTVIYFVMHKTSSIKNETNLQILSDNLVEQEQMKAILHSIGDGVIVLDAKKHIILLNQVAETLIGVSQKEVIGELYTKHIHFVSETDHKHQETFIEDVFVKNTITNMPKNTVLVQTDGHLLPVGDSAAPIQNTNGDVIGCVIVFRDESKEREIDKMKSEFVSVASHQLRTPLTSIKWFLEILLKEKAGKVPKKQREFIEQIFFSNERMIELVNDLLNVSRIETGKKFNLSLAKQNITPILRQVIRIQEVIARGRRIPITLATDFPETCLVLCDTKKIQDVLHNVLNNAIKYADEDSEISIGHHYSEEDTMHTFSFTNKGLGIPKKDQANIFKKFFRAENVIMGQKDGNGLGLYIAKSIVEKHHGRIWFESIEHGKTTFFISLPE